MRKPCLIALTLLLACSSNSTPIDAPAGIHDAPAAGPTLTVNNTLSWCDITVTVGTAAPVTFGTASKAFTSTTGTTVNLTATPHATFLAVMWTGTTSATGPTTYVMTSAPTQMVTGCCPLSNGTGC